MKPNNVINFNRLYSPSQKPNSSTPVIEHKSSSPLTTSKKISSLNKFLAGYCGCADLEILQQDACRQDRKKYVTIGTSVLFTALLASCSGGFALFTAFKSVELAAGFGILWGAIILNIDRAMLLNMTAKKATDDTFGKKFIKAIPRLVLSVAIGVVISTPLTLKVFDSEINATLANNFLKTEQVQKEKRQELEDTLKVKVNAIESEIKALRERRAQLDGELTKETQGKTASGIEGDGPAAKSIQKSIDDVDKQIKQKEGEKANETKRIAPDLAMAARNFNSESKIRQNSNGFLDRIAAREQLKEENHAAKMAIEGLEFLLIAIEVAPLLIKLMAERGNYEEILSIQQADSLQVSKDRQMYRRELNAKDEAIEYQSNLLNSQNRLLSIQSTNDPIKLKEYIKLIDTHLLKLNLNDKLVQKLMESLRHQDSNQDDFKRAFDEYRANLGSAEIAAYEQLFDQIKGLDRELLEQVINNFNSKPQTQAA